MQEEYVLELEGIRKAYGENVVLNNVSLAVKPGEIHALLGENGAGKSTLMNILFGMGVIHETGGFDGTVKISGKEVKFVAPTDALAAGIGMVHQEFMLIPGFTITENIKLGREDTTPTFASRIFGKSLEKLDRDKMNSDARRSLDSIGMGIEEHVKVAGLPVGYMQFVEIAREIDKLGIRLLVFDEPTAVLTESEASQLLDVMKTIAQKGIAIIFITHRLPEIMVAADNMTVLRDGELVATKPIAETSLTEIAEMMVGRIVENLAAGQDMENSDAPIAISVRDLHVEMPGERVHGVNFEVREGEIFGIGGMAGQGKVGIANGISGLFPAEGDVTVFGQPLNLSRLGEALSNNLAFVSEDRRGVGLLLDESIAYNIAFRVMTTRREFLSSFGPIKLLNSRKMQRHAEEMIKILDIRCRSWRQKVGTLSGGNQQKVCLASALTLKPRLLIVSEPTRGIDIGAKELIMNYLSKLRREEGLTIIMISSELGELRSLCDRIAIVTDGKIVDILPPNAPDADYGLAMSAVSKETDSSLGEGGDNAPNYGMMGGTTGDGGGFE
ncbi:MAG: sugar ABC transporter ATP-binding protein [Clostridiales bacterium]|nr:sugar ABC transporter ATP-binding protein [Clostridiales bacterium]